jgi:MoxR-like ATPase
LDRFFYKIDVPSPDEAELIEIARRTTGSTTPQVRQVADGAQLIAMQTLAREVPVEERVYQYAARLIGATHPQDERAPSSVRRHLRIGVSPRGIQAMVKAAKVEALLENRKAVSISDIRKVMRPALRHRMIMTFEAQAEGIPPDTILEEVLEAVALPGGKNNG